MPEATLDVGFEEAGGVWAKQVGVRVRKRAEEHQVETKCWVISFWFKQNGSPHIWLLRKQPAQMGELAHISTNSISYWSVWETTSAKWASYNEKRWWKGRQIEQLFHVRVFPKDLHTGKTLTLEISHLLTFGHFWTSDLNSSHYSWFNFSIASDLSVSCLIASGSLIQPVKDVPKIPLLGIDELRLGPASSVPPILEDSDRTKSNIPSTSFCIAVFHHEEPCLPNKTSYPLLSFLQNQQECFCHPIATWLKFGNKLAWPVAK